MNTSSMRVAQYRQNPNASIYFYDKRFFRGVMLTGHMEVLEDSGSKEMIWREGDTMYYPSGFSSAADDKKALSTEINLMIKDRFGLDIPVFIILQEELEEILKNAPDWWGNDDKEIYDNLIFIMPPLSYEEFYEVIGSPKAEYERVQNYKNAVFWSFSRKDYQKTNWWSKTAGTNVSGSITIRTANTVRKIAGL